jgi:hypothetical protein
MVLPDVLDLVVQGTDPIRLAGALRDNQLVFPEPICPGGRDLLSG